MTYMLKKPLAYSFFGLLLTAALSCASVGTRTSARTDAAEPVLRPSSGTETASALTTETIENCPETPGQLALELMNQARKDEGLPPLHVDVRLIKAAERHSRDMAVRGFFGHDGSDGSSAGGRAIAAGFQWVVVAENIAVDYEEASGVVTGWMDSPGHRENILSGGVTHVGVSFLPRPQARYRYYWTAVYGTPLEFAQEPEDGCHP